MAIRGYHLLDTAFVTFFTPEGATVTPDQNAPRDSERWRRWAHDDDIRKLNLGYYGSCKLLIYHYSDAGGLRDYRRTQQRLRLRQINQNGTTKTLVLRLDLGFDPDLGNPYQSGQNWADLFYPILGCDVTETVSGSTPIKVEVHNEPNLLEEKFQSDALKFNAFFKGAVDRFRGRGVNLSFGYPGLSPSNLAPAKADGWLQAPDTLATIRDYANWVGVHVYWPTGRWNDDAGSGNLEVGGWYKYVRQILNNGGVPSSIPLQITEYGNGDPLTTCDMGNCKGNEYKNWLNKVWTDHANFGVEQTQCFITQSGNTAWDNFILNDTAITTMRTGGG